MKNYFILLVLMLACFAAPSKVLAIDWPQFQQNSQRLGRTTDSIDPPYRARWIWMGPNLTLRNRASNSTWTNNLTTGSMANCPESKGNTADCAYLDMPDTINYDISEGAQPVISNGKVFIGTLDGGLYGINYSDGSTLWSKNNFALGGVATSAAVEGNVVVFASLGGMIYGLSTTDGSVVWTYEANKTITSHPSISNGIVYIADHGGFVYALNVSNGSPISSWSSNPVKLSSGVYGTIAVDATGVYVPTEDMKIYAINTSNGAIRASAAVRGQGFRQTHLVVFNNNVYVISATIPAIGSEYVAEDVMSASANLSDEEARTRDFIKGLGGYQYTSLDWQHTFILRSDNLQQATSNIPAHLPLGGTGYAMESFVVDNSNRVINWFKTKFPTLYGTQRSVFGSAYYIDLAAIDPTTGNRSSLGNNGLVFYPGETDNTFGLSVAGNYIWYRQAFRGTKVLKMTDPKSDTQVIAELRHHDGGNWDAYIVYGNVARNGGWIRTSQPAIMEHAPPSISGNLVFVNEEYGIVAIEKSN